MSAKPKTENSFVGPVRIPQVYKDGLKSLLKPHVTYSDLVREAIYLFLKQKGVIKDE